MDKEALQLRSINWEEGYQCRHCSINGQLGSACTQQKALVDLHKRISQGTHIFTFKDLWLHHICTNIITVYIMIHYSNWDSILIWGLTFLQTIKRVNVIHTICKSWLPDYLVMVTRWCMWSIMRQHAYFLKEVHKFCGHAIEVKEEMNLDALKWVPIIV